MMKLMTLKKKHGWSLLIIAHTPKRNLSNPISQNDLAGSNKLYNFFDSVIAIGQSAKDPGIKYVKQVKVRAGEYKYSSDNVIVHEIVSERCFVRFSARGFSKEKEHLKEQEDSEVNQEKMNVAEHVEAGKSIREIASELGISKSKAGRINFQLKNNPQKEEEWTGLLKDIQAWKADTPARPVGASVASPFTSMKMVKLSISKVMKWNEMKWNTTRI